MIWLKVWFEFWNACMSLSRGRSMRSFYLHILICSYTQERSLVLIVSFFSRCSSSRLISQESRC